MDGRKYYQWATLLPIVLGVLSVAVLLASDRWPTLLPYELTDNAGWVAPLMAMAIPPYGMVILAIPRLTRPTRTTHYRIIACCTPVVAGMLLGSAYGVAGAFSKGVHIGALALVVLGAWCGALVGMPMVVLVELGYWAGRAFGWIPSSREAESSFSD